MLIKAIVDLFSDDHATPCGSSKSFQSVTTLLLVTLTVIISPAQIRTLSGMVYEDDPMHEGYVNGKIYKNDGTVLKGLVLFNYSDADLRLKATATQKEFQKVPPDEVKGFTLEKDSFATLFGFVPEQYGSIPVNGYKRGFAKVLVNGPVMLYKHYGLQSGGNYRIIRVESFIVARKEEHLDQLITIYTSSRAAFMQDVLYFFKRDDALISDLRKGNYSFLDLRAIVSRYNEQYDITEAEKEPCSIILFRPGNNNRPEELGITVNDSLVHIKREELIRIAVNSRINKICVGESCTWFRSDKTETQHVECGFREKDERPFVQTVHPDYAFPYVDRISRRSDKEKKKKN